MVTVFVLEEEKCQNSSVVRVSSHSFYELLVHAEKQEEKKKRHNKLFFFFYRGSLPFTFVLAVQIYRATTLPLNVSCSKKVTPT